MAALDFASLMLSGAGTLVVIATATFFLQALASFLPFRSGSPTSNPITRFAVIVPAHDEAAVIERTLTSIRPQLAAGDRLVVIADNCSDDTGHLATQSGAEVIYRNDKERRGKGYALEAGVRYLAADTPPVVIVIDADCEPDPGCLGLIAALSAATQRPVQSLYDLEAPPDDGSRYLKVATFAWRIKNYVRPLGLHNLGLPCQLMGTGMAFPWPLITDAELGTSEIVEDMALGLDLARAGRAPLFCPEARVKSRFPATAEGQKTQRSRWETGHLTLILKRVPGLLAAAVRRRDLNLLALAADLAVPPLALLALATAAYLGVATLFMLLGASSTPVIIALIAAALFAGAVFLGWWKAGKDTLTLTELTLTTAYAISKIALYGRVLIGRRVEWIRTKRD